MLYIFTFDSEVYITSLDPDTVDMGTVIDNAFQVVVPLVSNPEALTNIARNVLTQGGAQVTISED